MKLKDKVIVVTGASDGIGKEVCLRLAKEGVRLAMIARNEEKLREVENMVRNLGVEQTAIYSCDVTDAFRLEEVARNINGFFGEVNVLLNIAGVWQKLNYIEDVPAEEVERVININLVGLIHMTRVMMPYLKQASEAAVINFASRSGYEAMPGQAIYCASKFGVRGFTEVLKEDLSGSRVQVAGVYPKGIKTNILQKAGDKISDEEFTEPADIADLICYMLSRPLKMWLHEVKVSY